MSQTLQRHFRENKQMENNHEEMLSITCHQGNAHLNKGVIAISYQNDQNPEHALVKI